MVFATIPSMSEFTSHLRQQAGSIVGKGIATIGISTAVDGYATMLRDKIASGKINPNWLQFRLGYWMGDFPYTMGVAVGTNILLKAIPKVRELPGWVHCTASSIATLGFGYAIEKLPLSQLGTLDMNDFKVGGIAGALVGLAVAYGPDAIRYAGNKLRRTTVNSRITRPLNPTFS